MIESKQFESQPPAIAIIHCIGPNINRNKPSDHRNYIIKRRRANIADGVWESESLGEADTIDEAKVICSDAEFYGTAGLCSACTQISINNRKKGGPKE